MMVRLLAPRNHTLVAIRAISNPSLSRKRATTISSTKSVSAAVTTIDGASGSVGDLSAGHTVQITLTQLAAVGARGLFIVVGTLVATFAFTLAAGRALGVDRKLTELIAAGTSICG